ncbi:nonstructural protein [robinz microvirus RP_109]|nr:nonstructural protein [robinz microvirus RP_109]
MNMFIVCIKDRTIDSFGQPHVFKSVGEAERSFRDLANDKENAIGRHPEDYDLYLVATYDTDTGVFTNVEHIHALARGSDQVRNN